MTLFLLTAAHDQPEGFRLAREYVRRAVARLDGMIDVAWIIADDGNVPLTQPSLSFDDADDGCLDCDAQIVYLRRPPHARGLRSFIGNMRELAVTLQQVAQPDDIAAVIEDDWFSAEYLRSAVEVFQRNASLYLWGETRTRYYRVDNRRYHVFRPNGRAALSATVMRATWGAREIMRWADWPHGTIMLDDVLWRGSIPQMGGRTMLLPESRFVVGIKGLPGAQGLGIGSQLDKRHACDPDGVVLRQWVGDDADRYTGFYREV